MTCPDCGNEMEDGYLYGKWPLLWSSQSKKHTLLRDREDVELFAGEFPAAHLCRACRRVIVEY